MTRSPAIAWQPHVDIKLSLKWQTNVLASPQFRFRKAPACLLMQGVGAQNRVADTLLATLSGACP